MTIRNPLCPSIMGRLKPSIGRTLRKVWCILGKHTLHLIKFVADYFSIICIFILLFFSFSPHSIPLSPHSNLPLESYIILRLQIIIPPPLKKTKKKQNKTSQTFYINWHFKNTNQLLIAYSTWSRGLGILGWDSIAFLRCANFYITFKC